MDSRHWKSLAVVLGVVIGTGTVTMGLGATVFVTRAEYTVKERNDAVTSSLTAGTLEMMKRQLSSQQEAFTHQQGAFTRLQEKIVELQTDLVVLGERKYLKTNR